MNSGTRVTHVKNPMIIHEESVSVNIHNIVIIGQCHSMKNKFGVFQKQQFLLELTVEVGKNNCKKRRYDNLANFESTSTRVCSCGNCDAK